MPRTRPSRNTAAAAKATPTAPAAAPSRRAAPVRSSRRNNAGSTGSTTDSGSTLITEKGEIDQVMREIAKHNGPGTIGMADEQRQPWRIPSGIFMFDLATLGGIPHNRLAMFHGPRSSGKTTAAEKVIAGAQRSLPNQRCAFVDVEHTRDADWGAKLGTDNESLIYANPGTGEQAVDITDALIRAREVSLVVLDSIAALVPMKEIADSAEDAHVGLQSKLVAVMTRKITHALIEERKRGHFVTLLVINQQRDDIGGWAPTGKPIKLPGGRALEFTTSLQCCFKNKETLSKNSEGFDMLDYNEHAFKLDKNKLNAGIRAGEYQLLRRDSDQYNLFEGDIDDGATMLAHAKKIGIYTGGGKAWKLAFGDFGMTFGSADDAITYLYDNRDIHWALRCHLIADHATRLRMPEYFVKYLLGE